MRAMKRKTHTAADIHTEDVFEEHITDRLVKEQGYVERVCEEHYNAELALDTGLLVQFLKDTQPDPWTQLEEHYKDAAEAELLKRLEKALRSNPTHNVLREGIKLVPNIKFSLCYFKPASALNPDLARLYEQNVLSVMRQVRYSTKNNNAIDLVLFVNGIPVATLEVKNLLTQQSFRHAEQQYRTDRPPAGEPLLTFKRGAIVHFALDQSYVSMTTRLLNGKTRFLPFNRGCDGGAGNSEVPEENPVAYLYKDLPEGKAVFSREVLLDLIGRFIHLEKKDAGETLIFPRFQQLEAVRKILDDARIKGAGHNYLIQHSAGSGKSNTIAWTVHQIINLHNAEDQAIFDSAIVVTDRLVLDRQLQDTISEFENITGVVRKIDGTSKDLKAAIEDGARIIITTIQKFNTEHLAAIVGQSSKNFAVIIDEAHSSQSGKSARSLTDTLTREIGSDNVEDIILAHQEARGAQKNISFFAFTATPRHITLERFGNKGPVNKPYPFHLYSMRQAIEEGFILDVLKNYTTYKAYYQLEKTIEEDPAFKGRRGQRRVARYASLHPTAIDQRVEVIVEHFLRHVASEIDGQAKAMVVTRSREHALRYWQRINQYIADKEIKDLKAIVAFSGELKADGRNWTEASANGFSDAELTGRFDTPEYQILVVAEKYQTGFDQAKLVAMYVDKKLSGIQAVQTLARLNRTHPKKEKTYIMDFENSADDIRDAFKPYFETTTLQELTDLSQIYDLEQRAMRAGYVAKPEVEEFAGEFFKDNLDTHDRIRLEGVVRLAVKRFEVDDDKGKQEEFRQLIRSFMRFYEFAAQVVKLNDVWLEKLYAYLSWLHRLLPSRAVPGDINITNDMLDLSAFKLEYKTSGDASLKAQETEELPSIENFGANPYTEDEKKSLSEIIQIFNERHGTQFTREDFLRFEQVNRNILDDDMLEMIRKNPADVVYGAFSQAFYRGMIRMFKKDNELRNIVMSDKRSRDRAIRHFFNRAIRQANEG